MSLQLLQNLIAQLEQEEKAYQVLIHILEDFHQALINNDRDAVNQCVQQQEEHLLILQQLDASRQERLQEISQQKNIPMEYLRLPSLIPMVMHPQTRVRLQELQKSLTEQAEKIKYLEQVNRVLLQQAMSFIDYSLDLFSEVMASSQDQVYSPYGMAEQLPDDDHPMLNYNA